MKVPIYCSVGGDTMRKRVVNVIVSVHNLHVVSIFDAINEL